MRKTIILKTIIFYLSVFLTTVTFAQVDSKNGNSEKGKSKVVILSNAKAVEKPKAIEPTGSDGFKKAFEQEQEKLKKQQAENDLNNSQILSQAKLNEERFAKNFRKINGLFSYPKIDQDLGSVSTKSVAVNIICRDFQYPDGDRVNILLNGVAVVYNIVLEQTYQKFYIPLETGVNKIEFVALNQGTSGPNTAAFKVYNDAGQLISENEWNLATGAKATLIVVKEK